MLLIEIEMTSGYDTLLGFNFVHVCQCLQRILDLQLFVLSHNIQKYVLHTDLDELHKLYKETTICY